MERLLLSLHLQCQRPHHSLWKQKADKQTITDNEINGKLEFDNSTPDFVLKPFTIRVFFEWFDGDGEQMNDSIDTNIGKDAVLNNTKLQISASISFTQSLVENQEDVIEDQN